MDAFKEWALSLIIAGMAGTLISLLSPRGTMEKTLRAVIGVFIVSAVVSPLSQILKEKSFLPTFAFENVISQADNSISEHMLDVCKSTVGTVISETADECGIDGYSVDADLDIGENNCIIIREICITIQNDDALKSSDFSAELEKKLGFPVTVNSE